MRHKTTHPYFPYTTLFRSDYSSAATVVAPRNLLALDVAPMSHAFETYPAAERMYTLMNHEMNHISQGDAAAAPERRWRRSEEHTSELQTRRDFVCRLLLEK